MVNQKIHHTTDIQIDKPFIKVLNSDEKGISNSRNLALKNAETQYVHFCDDDVEFLPNYAQTIFSTLEEFKKVDIFQFQILKSKEETFKPYSALFYEFSGNSLQNRRKILNISSIEIVAKLASIKENHLEFNTNFGVGSGKFPMGEEGLFLLDALEKGLSFRYIPKAIVVHEEESSGSKLGEAQLQSLGVLFGRVFGNFKNPFYFYYALKKRKILHKQGISTRQAYKIMKDASRV